MFSSGAVLKTTDGRKPRKQTTGRALVESNAGVLTYRAYQLQRNDRRKSLSKTWKTKRMKVGRPLPRKRRKRSQRRRNRLPFLRRTERNPSWRQYRLQVWRLSPHPHNPRFPPRRSHLSPQATQPHRARRKRRNIHRANPTKNPEMV